MDGKDDRPLVMHVLHRFDTGGLENGVVNLINRLPRDHWRHMVVALTEVTAFSKRLADPEVLCVALHKPPGHGLRVYPALWRLIREHRPQIVHTRNLAALEMQPVAWAAGVPGRVHGEHGRDVDDLDGTSVRHQRVRRLFSPFVQRYTTVSLDLRQYLVDRVRIAPGRIRHLCNGVDTDRFFPASATDVPRIDGCPWSPQQHWIVGAVGRLQAVKNPVLLARAFALALAIQPAMRSDARLVLVGDGAERAAVQTALDGAGVGDLAWLAGDRRDVPELMRAMDVFVLPSLAEGISNTLLEAMATGLPVLATRVGGNPELVDDGLTGELFASEDVEALATALVRHHEDRDRSRAIGLAAREAAIRRFSLDAMVEGYAGVYRSVLGHDAARLGSR
ncbi:MAG: TIGR03088 family PEP-CTERM/XrtA system glycosyltransferase [Rubrivivax sp.]|jgi:sugar transferase (PEP-CTERM/EpsH1 system associated)|nr:TIGR03088 family PEP-CTERM/XrtA system glycosyltransferase [Rubrivivax sp.]